MSTVMSTRPDSERETGRFIPNRSARARANLIQGIFRPASQKNTRHTTTVHELVHELDKVFMETRRPGFIMIRKTNIFPPSSRNLRSAVAVLPSPDSGRVDSHNVTQYQARCFFLERRRSRQEFFAPGILILR